MSAVAAQVLATTLPTHLPAEEGCSMDGTAPQGRNAVRREERCRSLLKCQAESHMGENLVGLGMLYLK